MVSKIKKINISIIIDILFAISLVIQDIDNFQLLGTPLYKYVILLSFALLLFDTIKQKRKIKINIIVCIFMLLIYAYLYIFRFNKIVVVPSVYFVVEYATFFLYVQSKKDKKELMKSISKVILYSATIISIFSIIQFISYKLNIKFIVDLITQKDFYLKEGRFPSIYTEPAHLCTIISSAMAVSVYYIINYKKRIYYFLLAMFVFVGVLSGSVVVYISMLLFIVLIYCIIIWLHKDKNLLNKVVIIKITSVIVITSIVCLFTFQMSVVNSAWNKVTSLFSGKNYSATEIGNNSKKNNNVENSQKPAGAIERDHYEEHTKEQNEILYLQVSNGTAYALKSNLSIGVEKLKDGYYLGTGMFTHLVYYDYYMMRLYPDGYFRLNYTDGCSMFIRIFSEFGIVGFVVFALLLLYLLIKSIRKRDAALLFILTIFVTQSMRLGEYNWILNCLSFVVLISFLELNNKYYIVLNKRTSNKIKRG